MTADHYIKDCLNYLTQLPEYIVWLCFLLENLVIAFLVLLLGRYIQKVSVPNLPAYSYSLRDWLFCLVTIVLNTVVTYVGYWLWGNNLIEFQLVFNRYILVDFILLFFCMDLLMFVLHFLIHKTPLHKVHELHHKSVHPKPIDLFILHPIETMSFGALWLGLLLLYPFNFYSVVSYLFINVLFGMLGHLGIEPFPASIRSNFIFRFLGTSSFHHHHHQYTETNYGFYTTIWDRLFGTFKK